jgi:hypothetical protein
MMHTWKDARNGNRPSVGRSAEYAESISPERVKPPSIAAMLANKRHTVKDVTKTS